MVSDLAHLNLNAVLKSSRWTAEEPGLLGSTFYVANLNQSEINKIRLVLSNDLRFLHQRSSS